MAQGYDWKGNGFEDLLRPGMEFGDPAGRQAAEKKGTGRLGRALLTAGLCLAGMGLPVLLDAGPVAALVFIFGGLTGGVLVLKS